MKYIFKLKKYSEIKNVINNGEKSFTKSFILYKQPILNVQDKENRVIIGILLSKKFGNAVKRNYAKRRIVAAINQCFCDINKNFIYVFIPKRQLIVREYQAILKEITEGLK